MSISGFLSPRPPATPAHAVEERARFVTEFLRVFPEASTVEFLFDRACEIIWVYRADGLAIASRKYPSRYISRLGHDFMNDLPVLDRLLSDVVNIEGPARFDRFRFRGAPLSFRLDGS